MDLNLANKLVQLALPIQPSLSLNWLVGLLISLVLTLVIALIIFKWRESTRVNKTKLIMTAQTGYNTAKQKHNSSAQINKNQTDDIFALPAEQVTKLIHSKVSQMHLELKQSIINKVDQLELSSANKIKIVRTTINLHADDWFALLRILNIQPQTIALLEDERLIINNRQLIALRNQLMNVTDALATDQFNLVITKFLLELAPD